MWVLPKKKIHASDTKTHSKSGLSWTLVYNSMLDVGYYSLIKQFPLVIGHTLIGIVG